jgi:hypothetical protein
MSSEIEVINNMRGLIQTFLNALKFTIQVQPKRAHGLTNASNFYEKVYDLGRYMYLYPNYRELFTNEDREIFKETFLDAFVSIICHTPGVVNNLEAHELNIAKTKLSELTFLKKEIFDYYKEVCGNEIELTDEVKSAIEELEDCMDMLEDQIKCWSRHDHPFAESNSYQVPILKGVPQTHYWWTNEQRNMRN